MDEPTFPAAAELDLSARYQQDVSDLAHTLKFSNPHELLAHWELLVTRLLHAEVSFAPAALLDGLLGEMYAFYRDEQAATAQRLERARQDPRLDAVDVARLERGYETMEAYRQQILVALPPLRQLLLETAGRLIDRAAS